VVTTASSFSVPVRSKIWTDSASSSDASSSTRSGDESPMLYRVSVVPLLWWSVWVSRTEQPSADAISTNGSSVVETSNSMSTTCRLVSPRRRSLAAIANAIRLATISRSFDSSAENPLRSVYTPSTP
jgi:hypothetical protein